MSYLHVDAQVQTGREPDLLAAEKRFRGDEFFFYRHQRNGKWIVPGTILVELMGETTGVHRPHAPRGMTVKIRFANFFHPVFSTDRLVISAQRLSQIGDAVLHYCEVKVDDRLCANAEIILQAAQPEAEMPHETP